MGDGSKKNREAMDGFYSEELCTQLGYMYLIHTIFPSIIHYIRNLIVRILKFISFPFINPSKTGGKYMYHPP
jgi:hypothetical protein